MRDANAAAHNAQRQQVQQSVGAQAPPIATQVSIYIYVLFSQQNVSFGLSSYNLREVC